MTTKRIVESAVADLLKRPDVRPNLDFLRSRLPREARVYIVGGAIRNRVIEFVFGEAPKTRDIDIFIGGLPREYPFEELLAGQAFESTDLGGVRWRPASSAYAFDLCPLSNFIILVKNHLPPTVENLLACIDFTANAAVFDIDNQRLHESHCIAAVEKRLLDFNTTRFITKLLLSYRILLIGYKTGFTLSKGLFAYLKNHVDVDTLSALKSVLKKKVGKETGKAIMGYCDRICSFTDHETYKLFEISSSSFPK